jgi:hypothetical protein
LGWARGWSSYWVNGAEQVGGRADAEEDAGRSGQLVVDADLPVESPASIAAGGGDGERKNEQGMRRVGLSGGGAGCGWAVEQRRRWSSAGGGHVEP